MANLFISIDGACRNNGKPNCVSSGAAFVQRLDDNNSVVRCEIASTYEIQSTNQRGEMMALLMSLDHIFTAKTDAIIVTDSEYIFNTMTRGWLTSWKNNSWLSSSGMPVKNNDIWQEIAHAYDKCVDNNIDIVFYHIKGHVIPFGKVTAMNLLERDNTGEALRKAVELRYDELKPVKVTEINNAQELSDKNNGFALDEDVLKRFIVANTVVDAAATRVVEHVNSLP